MTQPTMLKAFILFLFLSNSLLAAPIKVCSFNIQFLGNTAKRDDAALASILINYDIVVVQELDAPPYAGTFPDGSAYKPSAKAAMFFDAMKANGFQYALSEEDTGPGKKNHLNSSATEWWVTFFKPAVVKLANDLPNGFLSQQLTANPDFDRVPFAFGFRSADAKIDFVLISVHLRPSAGLKNKARRQHELAAIAAWVHTHNQHEKNFFILGDTNIENASELIDDLPSGFESLNRVCLPTNTNVNNRKPYDQIMFEPQFTANKIDSNYGFHVVDLIPTMKPIWKSKNPGKKYPGDNPYNHNSFRQYYSDHDPVDFKIVPLATGDDDH